MRAAMRLHLMASFCIQMRCTAASYYFFLEAGASVLAFVPGSGSGSRCLPFLG